MDLRLVALATALASLPAAPGWACTAFSATCGSVTLVGNNEDYDNPRTRIWFVPSAGNGYGRMYLGYDNGYPQGGMNEAGLFFDGFAVDQRPATTTPVKPRFDGVFVDKVMAECRTVEEVVRLFEQYDRSFLESAILMFVDSRGDAVAIEADAIVRKTGSWFVQTNFRQSLTPRAEISCPRFKTATRMLEQMQKCATVDGFRPRDRAAIASKEERPDSLRAFRKILAATSVEGRYPTLYSNVYDLEHRVMHLYYFRDFEHPKTIDLAQELSLGAHTLEMAALFPENKAARAFARDREQELARKVVAVDEAVLEVYVGRYRLEDGTVVIVRKEGTRLSAETPGPSVVELLPESARTFFVAGTPVKVTFVVGASGKAEQMDLLSGTGARRIGQRMVE